MKKKSNELKIKENNELKREIKKLKRVKIQKLNIIDDLVKSDKASNTFPKIFQDVRKRGDKARTFAQPDNNDELYKIKDLAEETLVLTELTNLKKIKDFEKTTDVYDRINLNDVNDLINEIEYNVNEGNNIVDFGDNKSIYFRDLHKFLYDIKDNKINNFNKK